VISQLNQHAPIRIRALQNQLFALKANVDLMSAQSKSLNDARAWMHRARPQLLAAWELL